MESRLTIKKKSAQIKDLVEVLFSAWKIELDMSLESVLLESSSLLMP